MNGRRRFEPPLQPSGTNAYGVQKSRKRRDVEKFALQDRRSAYRSFHADLPACPARRPPRLWSLSAAAGVVTKQRWPALFVTCQKQPFSTVPAHSHSRDVDHLMFNQLAVGYSETEFAGC